LAFYSYPGSFASYPGGYAAYPTAFAAPQAQAASAAEGSQADEAASQHGVSVSGFGAPIAHDGAFFGGYPYGTVAPGYGQTFIHQGAAPMGYGQTILPGTFLQQTAVVPVAAPRVRRPGYNERLVAWRNRQKAFNRYKRATKEAIKNANSAHQGGLYAAPGQQLPQTVFGAQPVFGGQSTIIGGYQPFPAYGGAYGGATYLAAPAPYFLPQGFGAEHVQEGQQEYNQEFSNYSASAQQQEVQQEEPEIRGTQV